MTQALPSAIVIYLGLVAAASTASALGIRTGAAAITGAVVAEVLLVVNAVLDVIGVVRVHRPAELATHLGYVAVSVALLPLLVRPVPAGRTPSSPSPIQGRRAVLALACLTEIVVVLRQRATS